MQQPYSQPGGSYGNASYAAPPKRRFNWMACCLGCLGVLVLIAVVIGVFVARNAPAWKERLEQAAGASITAANYRAEFPEGVPDYPGMTLDEPTTSAMRYGGAFVAVFPKTRGAKLRLMAFRSPKGIQVIGPWYKQKLTPQGWTSRMSDRKGTSWEFKKGDVSFLVSANYSQPGLIMLGVAKALPGDGSVHINP